MSLKIFIRKILANKPFGATRKMHQSQKGIALLMAIFCVMIMAFIAVEITYDTSVDYVLSSKEYGRIKAYEAAKAGIELSLLRIQLYKNVINTMGDQLKGQESYLQMIWSFPFLWPPQIPKDTSITDKDQITGTISDSFMEATYQTSITSEGSKIDINDLDSPSDALKKSTKDQLLRILVTKLENDETWQEQFQERDFEELVNNFQDWVDEDTSSLNGGDESSKYPNKNPNDIIPPSRPFQTLDEIRAVAGMTEEIFQFLISHITIYGVKGINVNQANKDLLKSIDPIITEDIANEMIERRGSIEKGGPFQNDQDLISFIGANAENFNPSKVPLYYGSEYNFRIRSIGTYNKTQREIIAIVYDVDEVKTQLKNILDQEAKEKQTSSDESAKSETNPTQPQSTTSNETQKKLLSTTKPRVVYWYEN